MDPSGPALGGLEPAVAMHEDKPAGEALWELRQAGASLAVIVDAHDSPQKAVSVRTLAAAPPGQKAAACTPAWPAATFVQPGSAQDARRLAAHSQSQPWSGHRTVIVENGQIAGVVPVPSLIRRPGLTSRMLERLFGNTGLLIARMRYGRMPGSLHRNRPPSPGPNHGARR